METSGLACGLLRMRVELRPKLTTTGPRTDTTPLHPPARGAVRRWLWAILPAAVLAGCGGGGGGGGGVAAGNCVFPASVVTPILTSTDPFLATQAWHLDNTGQFGGTAGEDIDVLGTAWTSGAANTNKGFGVRVGIIDDAIDIEHEDLRPNAFTGLGLSLSFNYRDGSGFPRPCSVDDDHGTAVAGIVAARDTNGRGAAGVAPRATIVGLNALATSTVADISDALQRDVAVSNNSWGAFDDREFTTIPAPIAQAISTATANGRGGLGTVILFSGGNGGNPASPLLADNANYDGYIANRRVIPVCAVDRLGDEAPYSERGENILVCAPSSDDTAGFRTGIFSTYPGNQYRPARAPFADCPAGGQQVGCPFSGTSASTPMAAGVVALMLEANPNLSWRDVRLILALSARKNRIGSNPGDWSTTRNAVTSVANYCTSGVCSNASLNRTSPKYGYGVVDGAEAVRIATNWRGSLGGSGNTGPTREIVCTRSGTANALASAAGNGVPGAATNVSLSISAADCSPATAIQYVEAVEVTVTGNTQYSGALRITLRSPLRAVGDVATLASERVCAGTGDACGSLAGGWTFVGARFLDEPANGTWTVSLANAILTNPSTAAAIPQNTGPFGVTLRIYGRAANPS